MESRYYPDTRAHLRAELARVDLLLRQAVRRFRAERSEPVPEFPGLYITDAEVDAMLAGRHPLGPGFQRPADRPAVRSTGGAPPADMAPAADIARAVAGSDRRGVPLRLPRLAAALGLSGLEVDILLVALAAELDLRYERLFAYLQDDVTRRRPGVDLALNLLCHTAEEKWAARRCFTPAAPLRAHRLLDLVDDPAQPDPPLLGKYLRLDERIVAHLLGDDDLDQALAPYARLADPAMAPAELVPAELAHRLTAVAGEERRLYYLHGPAGAGKRTAAAALAGRLLVVDGERVPRADLDDLVRRALREAVLQRATLYWTGADGPPGLLLERIAAGHARVILAGEHPWEPSGEFRDLPFSRIEVRRPGHADRAAVWTRTLNGSAGTVDVERLAGTFRLSGAQIADAAATARNLARAARGGTAHPTTADLLAGCRWHARPTLSTLARRIVPTRTENDLILPSDQRRQLAEIGAVIRHRGLVHDEWGFGERLALGSGVTVLFAGPSGTGKTMAAEVLAAGLGLDLYRLDLSAVVSKYIGETEKHLAQVFAEAESGDAILFCDEADALFGQRSEVHDAHDRYANIEVSFLLQRLEEHQGVVVLATNLRKNMDAAFVRRMRFAVDFPMPGEADRRRIWQRVWPATAPVAADVDLDMLAGRFDLSGGSIRDVAVAAAFRAAEAGTPITMEHLLDAVGAEYRKLGRVTPAEVPS
ncbi:hypothetical protein BJY16_007547 [Actinoplanes octamycinicus]|uniref:AAA+ ATPase domain-containing protein n=1 Tax=Actinoplanes octamycinicus TaxID=135948 RepID=A0A7W7H4Y8_9ACTN|nr:ATP-binding protein [Actinoplanes octamycinicus]MBB4744088.1 hypothetical protein [Actinoplanes octamycinicus]GIE56955.1 ATPase AAA [Actinoplanes octamycinicus]